MKLFAYRSSYHPAEDGEPELWIKFVTILGWRFGWNSLTGWYFPFGWWCLRVHGLKIRFGRSLSHPKVHREIVAKIVSQPLPVAK